MAGGTKFSKIDLTSAYKQLHLDEESEDLTTVNTHKGFYKYTRLPFGVASTPSMFQQVMDTVLQGLPNVLCYLDDVLVTGSTVEEYLSNLEGVLKCLQQQNIHGLASQNMLAIQIYFNRQRQVTKQSGSTGILPMKNMPYTVLIATHCV